MSTMGAVEEETIRLMASTKDDSLQSMEFHAITAAASIMFIDKLLHDDAIGTQGVHT